VVCQWRSIHAADGAIDRERHPAIHGLDIKLIFLATVAGNFQFHRIISVGSTAENYLYFIEAAYRVHKFFNPALSTGQRVLDWRGPSDS
jgi:hypothetical protein